MKHIRFEIANGVAALTFNRPTKRNAMDMAMREEIGEAVGIVRRDRGVRALILTGSGEHFCSGGDLNGIAGAGLDNEGWRNRLIDLHAWLADLITLDRPVIAAVDGVAYGAGFSLALTADFILATPRARFNMAFVRVGGVPDCGAWYTLPRVVGVQRAKEIMLSGRELDAQEALRLGIALEVVEPDQLQWRARSMAESFVDAPQTVLGMTKRALSMSLNSDLASMLEMEANAQALAFGTSYHREALTRFGSKMPAKFQWPGVA